MYTTPELDLYPTKPVGRTRGPIQSQLTVESLGRDGSLKRYIVDAVVAASTRHELRHYSDGDSICVLHDRPVTDDDITDRVEGWSGRRQQRNVIARTRGLLERDGYFDPVPDVIGRTGRPTHAVVPSALLLTDVLMSHLMRGAR